MLLGVGLVLQYMQSHLKDQNAEIIKILSHGERLRIGMKKLVIEFVKRVIQKNISKKKKTEYLWY